MKCEHAQEFFSEYIEQTLDKPSAVAIEAHLTACQTCRRGVEGLRQTWTALGTVPLVEPPKDLAWRIRCQLQQERLERMEAERKRGKPFIGWLQALTPGAAFGYALLVALLFVALAFPLRGPFEQERFGIGSPSSSAPSLNGPDGGDATPRTLALAPRVSVEGPWQESRSRRWFYSLTITPATELGSSSIRITPLIQTNGQLIGARAAVHQWELGANRPAKIPVEAVIAGARVQAISVSVQASGFSPFEAVIPLAPSGRGARP
jgi:hypothetical protein